MANITEMIYSNEYADYILPYSNANVTATYAEFGAQLLDTHYFLIHDNRQNPTFPVRSSYDILNEYLFMPKLFLPLSTVSLEAAGIIQSQTQPYLNLNGKGTILGFIDSGIDYTHKAFRTKDGRSRILSIWDQTVSFSDTSPINPYHYGTIYTNDQINAALQSDTPLDTVPSIDEIGHGTALAGIAAGTPFPENDFTGAAFEADICVVKLKPAKQYLRDYYFANDTVILYQENDIMMGINFLIDFAAKEGKPLIICLGLGTNQGDHAGNSPISKMITNRSYDTYTIFSIASGSEGNKAHHYFHNFSTPALTITPETASQAFAETLDDIEIIVPANSSGFVAELWGSTNALFSIGFQSPLGTQIAPITASPGKNDLVSFILEKTKIQMTYSIVPESGGDQLVFFRFENPTEGNWIIRVYNRSTTNAAFHVWLPAFGVLTPNITFLKPTPETTLTIPSDADSAITTGFYNAYTNGMVAETGRGFTRQNLVKPNIISPGINVTAPKINPVNKISSSSQSNTSNINLSNNPVTTPINTSTQDTLNINTSNINTSNINTSNTNLTNASSGTQENVFATNQFNISLQNQFITFSGSSAACALLAGGIAQLQQWRLDAYIPNIINANSMNAYITRGAIRDDGMNYPNPVSGYGKLNIYNVFQSLMS